MAKEHKKAPRNQLERLWLAELEARMDAVQLSAWRVDCNSDFLFRKQGEWQESTRTFWQRLVWLFLG